MKKTTIILTLIAAAVVLGGFAGAAAAATGEPYVIYLTVNPADATVQCTQGNVEPFSMGHYKINLGSSGTAQGIPNPVYIKVGKNGYQQEVVTVYTSEFNLSGGEYRYDRSVTLLENPGYLSVSSSPTNASVYIDGAYEGTTPLNEALSPGTHSVRVTKNGYSSYSTSVRIYEGQTNSINVSLSPVTSTGYLSVSSTPKYADVYVDNSYMGQTPLTITTDEGVHAVRLQKTGYSTYTASVRVNAGQTSTVSAYLSETVTTGYVSITSSPSGASVYIDGAYVGTTPSSSYGSVSYLSAGPYSTNSYHTVQIKLAGYETYSTSFKPQEKTPVVINAVLTSSGPTTAGLHVTSVPAGASVYVDNVYYGTTPATIPGLQPGSHTVKVSALGYNDSVSTISVVAGQSVELPVTLTPTSAPGKSPVPILGILAGLAAAGIFFAARRH